MKSTVGGGSKSDVRWKKTCNDNMKEVSGKLKDMRVNDGDSGLSVEWEDPDAKEQPDSLPHTKMADKKKSNNGKKCSNDTDSGLGIEAKEDNKTDDNSVLFIKNAENISKQCRNIISQISPLQRMQIIQDAFAPDKEGDTLLHLAVIDGRLDIICTLIYLIPDSTYLDVQNLFKQTPLHLAVLSGSSRVVRRLVLGGASQEAKDYRGNTPLHLACENGAYECVKELTRAVTSEEFQYLELMNSINQTVPSVYIPNNFEMRNNDGQTCIHLATRNNHTDVVLWLKHFGANINAQESKSGRTALAFAVESGNANLVQFLIEECEADVEVKNYAGFTPYQIAAYRMKDNKLVSAFITSKSKLSSDSFYSELMDTDDEDEDYELGNEEW